MNVKLNTIVSRFPFPLCSFHSDSDEEESDAPSTRDGSARTSVSVTRRQQRLSSAGSAVTHTALDDGMDGAQAFIQRSSGSSTSTMDRTQSAARTAASRGRGRTVDLVRVASSMWNAELQRSATTAAPTVCVLRPPPFVFDNVVYRAASAYVLPSGVVRLVTYGSVPATRRIAHRVRRALKEAYTPAAVRRAAKAERHLLRAVFDVGSGAGDAAGCTKTRTSGARQDNDEGLSLADALAKSTSRAVTKAAGHETEVGAAPTAGGDGDGLKIDFIQSVATPRWSDIAGLRAALFCAPTKTGDAAPEGVGDGDESVRTLHLTSVPENQLTGSTRVADESVGHVAASASPSPFVQPVAVSRASVNVRGDAPLAWWRWFLAAGTQQGSGASAVVSPPTAASLSEAAAGGGGGQEELGGVAHSPATAPSEVALPADRVWTCAGHSDVPPSSPQAAAFVRFLAHKRLCVAHHVVSFKVRRNASQSSIQLLLEWNTAPFVQPSFTNVPRFKASAASQLPTGGAPKWQTAVEATPHTQGDESRGQSGLRLRLTSRQINAAETSRRDGREGWVSEASVANFFLESTFIAESTLPYGLESTRPSPGLEDGALTSAPPDALDAVRSPSAWGGKEERKLTLPDSASTTTAELYDATVTSLQRTQTGKTGQGAPKSAQPGHCGLWKRQRHAEAEKSAPVVTEQVSCMIHRTGRVQLSTGTEGAIRQLCDVLLIPFLVSTADLTL